MLNRLLEVGENNFEHGISASQYQAVAKVSKVTATCHFSELAAGGRSTRYHQGSLDGVQRNLGDIG